VPTSIAQDSDGYLYITETLNNRIKTISQFGNITTVNFGIFFNPVGIAIDSVNNTLFVTDLSHRVYRVNISSGDKTVFAGTGIYAKDVN
jgi:DNA-binding beta-propeller fold protein YncE